MLRWTSRWDFPEAKCQEGVKNALLYITSLWVFNCEQKLNRWSTSCKSLGQEKFAFIFMWNGSKHSCQNGNTYVSTSSIWKVCNDRKSIYNKWDRLYWYTAKVKKTQKWFQLVKLFRAKACKQKSCKFWIIASNHYFVTLRIRLEIRFSISKHNENKKCFWRKFVFK